MILYEFTIAKAGPIDWLAGIMGKIFNFIFEILSKVGIENTALCIILFTILIKALMLPINIKQQKFSKLSSRMNPEIMAITAKYKNKKDEQSIRKQNIEMQAVYEKYGASPTSGCLPLLITFPIIIALYRVIYDIPKYIEYVGDLYDKIAQAIMSIDGYEKVFAEFAAENVKTVTYEASDELSSIVNVIKNLNTEQWADLAKEFSSQSAVINECSEAIINVNKIPFGLNITNTPILKIWPGIIIPVLAVFTQWLQTKQISSNQTADAKDNPTMQSMMMMTKIMPFFSGLMCLMLPIGVGIYWVIGSVFQICQQFFVNKYMDKLDIDEMVAKNAEKLKKRKEKLGIDPNMSIAEYTQSNTRAIAESSRKKTSLDYNNKNKSSNYKDSLSGESKEYKKGSISDYANLMNPNRKN